MNTLNTHLILQASDEACKILVAFAPPENEAEGIITSTESVEMRVVGYIRISKEEQNSHSLSTQAEAIRRWCDQGGHELVRIYTDDGVSGGTHPTKRAGGQAAIAHARRNGVDALLVTKLDRVARDLAATLDLVDNVLGRHATLISISENVDGTTPSGRMFLQMLGSFAEFERGRIRERTREGLATVRRLGRKTGGSIPFGYSVDDENYLIEQEDEQAVLKRARDLRAEGLSWRSAADKLNEEGFYRRERKSWTPSRLCDVLTADFRRRG